MSEPTPTPPSVRMAATIVKTQALEGREIGTTTALALALWVLGELSVGENEWTERVEEQADGQ